jgi:linearmycin/streptolysin S transport system ATP-binding protein
MIRLPSAPVGFGSRPPDPGQPAAGDLHMSTSTPGPVLVCRDLRKRYGERQAVDGVGFEISAGETYGLLGPNGAGKTTSISMICGLLRRDGGEVFVAGRPVDIGATDAKAAIGYVPQDLAIYPDLTARENLRFFGQLQRLRGKELDRRVDEVLAVIDLADRAGERTEGFSGGMKRRLNIGIGLLHHPRLLVLDEPTVGVDPQSRNAILTSVAALEQEGMAILYTTHYMEEAERLCDRIGIIDEGKIRAEGTRRELVALVGGKDRVELTAGGTTVGPAADALRTLEGVEEATVSDGRIMLVVEEARHLLPKILETAAAAGAVVRSVEVVEPDLEAVFLHLTGKALRD